MNQSEVIRLLSEADAPGLEKEIDAQHKWFADNLSGMRDTLTKELYLKALNEKIAAAAKGIQDAIISQIQTPNDGYFRNRVLVYRLCQKNIAFAKNEINKKHAPGPKEKSMTFVDLFTGDNPEEVARMVIEILKNNGFIDEVTGNWIKPEYNKDDKFIAKPFHVLRDAGVIISDPVDEPYRVWCDGVGWEMTCTLNALKDRRKGGAEFEQEHDSDYKTFVKMFAPVLLRNKF